MLCLIYARVSTEDQARHGFSLGAQVRECQERAVQLGYAEAQQVVLLDEGYSGDAVDRPGLNRLRDLVAHPGSVGHVVILDPDRFARNLSLQLIVTEEIIRGGASLEFLNFDWQDTPEGKLFYSLRGAISEYEKAKIRERTRRGREQKARQGLLPIGKSLYGYHFDPVTDLLQPVEHEQAVLRVMRDLMLGGERLSAVGVARWLAVHGIPAPRGARWYASTVARMMRHEAYTGTYRVLGGRYAITIPSIWDAATHQALCSHLAERQVRRRRPPGGALYLVSGLLTCGACGRRMQGHAVKDQRRDYRYYLCDRAPSFAVDSGERSRCGHIWHYPAGEIDQAIWAVVVRLVESAPLRPKPDRRGAERKALAGALIQRRAEHDRYLRLFAAGHIADEERLAAMLTPVSAAIRSLEERLLALQVPVAEAGRPVLVNLGEEVRRQLTRLIVRRAVLLDGSLTLQLISPVHAQVSVDRQLE